MTEKEFKNYVKELPNINQIILDLNTKHTDAEHKLLSELSNIKIELSEQKDLNRDFLSKNYEETISELEQKLIYTNNELDHAKRNLIQYIQSVNNLEEMIRQSQGDITENEEIQRLRLENIRLNEENTSIITSRKEMDEFYAKKINELENLNHRQKTENNLLSREYDKLSLSIASTFQNLEVWRDREQTIRENYDKMEQKLASMVSFKKTKESGKRNNK